MEKEYKQLKKEIEQAFKKVWGPRCKTKDMNDFPDLRGKPAERCMTCLSYDRLDNFMASLQESL